MVQIYGLVHLPLLMKMPLNKRKVDIRFADLGHDCPEITTQAHVRWSLNSNLVIDSRAIKS